MPELYRRSIKNVDTRVLSMETALPGLYAGNPMAAMAAYGLLRSVSGIQMRWREDDIPVVNISAADVVEAAISAVLSAPPLPQQKMTVDEYRTAMATGDPEQVAWLQSWGCEVQGKNEPQWKRSTLVLPAGPQNLNIEMEKTREWIPKRPKRMHAALFATWDYADSSHNSYLDPMAHRSHTNANRPPGAGLPKQGMRGAFGLAMLAYPYYPCQPFRGDAVPNTWTIEGPAPAHKWVTWDPWLDSALARYLIQHPMISQTLTSQPQPPRLEIHGIQRVWRSERLHVRDTIYRLGEGRIAV